jgi:NhaP-type Na+/H+ or K+/H+ antiporter
VELTELELAIGLVALAVAAYGLLAAALARWSVSAAFAFLVIGAMIGGFGIGVGAADVGGSTALGILAEVTLALVLFSAASTVRLKRLEMDSPLVGRLLVVGLPLTIITGTLLALGLFPGISLGLALLIGTILAPTDADLGHQVVTDRSVPARIRRLLNVESGLNDGIAAPVVTLAIALAAFGGIGEINPLIDAVVELGVALIVGVVIGASGRWLLIRTDIRKTSTRSSRALATFAIALAAYFLASGLAASGFIAAFAAGLAFGIGSKERVAQAVSFTEAQSVALSIVVWLVFGLLVAEQDLLALQDPMVVVYALLALTVVRIVPVALALLGSGFDRVSVLFLGWFGPRGLASVVFVLLALEALDAAGVESDPLGQVVSLTIVLSVILHGFSARGLASRYGRYAKRLPEGSPELLGDEEPRRANWSFHGHRMRTP